MGHGFVTSYPRSFQNPNPQNGKRHKHILSFCFAPFHTAVIMTPTRELALQITKECKKFSKPLGLRVVCVYGGTGISEQVNMLTVMLPV